MTQYRILEKGSRAELFGVAYQRNRDIWLFVPAWRSQKKLDVQRLEELSPQHYPSARGPYHWSAVREYPEPLDHPIDLLRYHGSRIRPKPVIVPTLDLIAKHLPDLLARLEQSAPSTLFSARHIALDNGDDAVCSALQACLEEEHALGQDNAETTQSRMQTEEAMAHAIRRLVEARTFSGNTSKIALALADALGPPDSERLDQAIAMLGRLVLETDTLEARLLLAFCYRKRGGLDDAEEQLRKAVGLLRQMRGRSR
jgi:hypothetical protein